MGYRLPISPGTNEPLLSLGSMAHCLFVSLLTALLTVCQGSQLFVSLVVSLNTLWAPRGKNSAFFTLTAPTEAITAPFTWWAGGGTNQCLSKQGKMWLMAVVLVLPERSQWKAYPDSWGPQPPCLLDPSSTLHQLPLLSPVTALPYHILTVYLLVCLSYRLKAN